MESLFVVAPAAFAGFPAAAALVAAPAAVAGPRTAGAAVMVAPLAAAAVTTTAAQAAGAAVASAAAASAGIMISVPLLGVAGWTGLSFRKAFKARASAPQMTATMDPAMPEAELPPPPPPKPLIQRIRVGDKTLAGDFNFDPLDISDTPGKLAWYREAEIRHARLAMLAAFGWPVSEILNFGKLLTSDGRAPALFNGGLENVNGVYWLAVVALAIFAEKQALDKQFGKQDDYLPGMLGFDPLGLDSESMRNAEVLNGRVAMMAITAFALEEAVSRGPIFPLNLFH